MVTTGLLLYLTYTTVVLNLPHPYLQSSTILLDSSSCNVKVRIYVGVFIVSAHTILQEQCNTSKNITSSVTNVLARATTVLLVAGSYQYM